MHLSDRTIQQVRDLSITLVISQYEKLDRNGKACCPFHDEKSPSFKVTEAKGIYKCFGCGVAGDHIRFVMEREKLGFIEAVVLIAEKHGIPLEYEEVADEEQYKKKKALKDQLREVLEFVITDYKDQLWKLPDTDPVMIYLASRGITREIIAEWQLGWSTIEWQHLSSSIINRGWFEPANQLGLVKRSQDDRNYDGYRSRITFPITNKHDQYIGLSGRFIEIDTADAEKKNPKYINPPQNEIYDKSHVLYGLSRAIKKIGEAGFAYLVEGYTDVISMHTHGQENTVATCGTALTNQQAELLHRYTNRVVLMRDGDAAGVKATIRDLQVLLKAGIQVEVCALPESEDPDTYVQKDPTLKELKRQDGIYWYITHLLIDADDDHFQKGKIIEQALQLLSLIPNAIIRSNYFDGICKKYKWKKVDLQKQFNEMVEHREDILDDGEGKAINKLPKWMDRDHYENHGYSPVNNKNRTGYYTYSGDKSIEVTNFLITPIFHVYAGKDSRYLILIDNGKKKSVVDVESKALTSPEILQSIVVGEGCFIIHGNKSQMLRIASRLLDSFKMCYEIKFLGWQEKGFFAYVDKIFVPGKGMIELDEWGVYTHQAEEPINYLVPAASQAYKELQKSGNDEFENHRVLAWKNSPITFSQWAVMMQRVYREKGPVAIAYCILTMFRDIIFDIDNNCPHLYGWGERSSGKSKWAESINAMFYTRRPAFNLNSGTDFAFFDYLQRFINGPSFLNEFDEKVIRPEWFQAIKGAFDGEGRQKGVMGSPNRVQIMKIRSTLILIGQYLNTADDNSIVSRSIIEHFSEKEHTDEDKKEYDRLKGYEEKGLSSMITDVVKHRDHFKTNYRNRFNDTLSQWRHSIDGDSQNFNQRIMQNWCHLFTSWKLLSDHIALPMENDQFEEYCKARAIQWSNFIRTSDTLSEFWLTLNFLADGGLITDGWDYKIETVMSVRIRKNDKEEQELKFETPTKVIYIRMNNIHKHYQQAYRSRTGKEGMTMENLKYYFGSRKYYLGSSKQKRFNRFVIKSEKVPIPGTMLSTPATRVETTKVPEVQIGSSHIFLYDQLNLELERVEPEFDGHEEVNRHKPAEITEPVDDLPF